MLDESFRDYSYCRDEGWFEAECYYPIRPGLLKKPAGRVFDLVAAVTARRGDDELGRCAGLESKRHIVPLWFELRRVFLNLQVMQSIVRVASRP